MFQKYKCDAVCVANLEVTKCLKSREDGGKWVVGAGLGGGYCCVMLLVFTGNMFINPLKFIKSGKHFWTRVICVKLSVYFSGD